MTGTLASRVRVRSVKVLDRFAARALYVRGIRVEVCPYNTLFWRPEFEYSDHDMGNLTQEEEWTYAVIPPPEIEDMAKPLEKDTAEALRVRRQVATAGDD